MHTTRLNTMPLTFEALFNEQAFLRCFSNRQAEADAVLAVAYGLPRLSEVSNG